MKAVVRELKAVLKGMRAEAKRAAREMARVERLLAAAGGGTTKKKRAYKKRAKQQQKDESETVVTVRKVKSGKSAKPAKRHSDVGKRNKPGPKPRIKSVEPDEDEVDDTDSDTGTDREDIQDENFIERKRERLAKIRGRVPSQNSGGA